MSKKFLFVNTGTEPVVVKETFAEGNWTRTIVQPGEHKTIALWGGKHVEVLARPMCESAYGDRYVVTS